ncbi:MAG: sulfatase-like hydrolase/transferase [Planctomycetes bacterium]|nr:sulfatase-like hydrolase/transferase [Planctomycetota bacterium]
MARSSCLLALLMASVIVSPALAASPERPNVLLILTDQQHAGMLSSAGNPYVRTPAMDSLAAAGVRFERAYCGNPVCVPSRFGMLTGVMPSRIGMESNNTRLKVPESILVHSMGRVFRDAGYETSYGGKLHTPMKLDQIGFDLLTVDQREELADQCVAFLKRKHEKPFLLVASFINPHDICYMAIRAHAEAQKGAAKKTSLKKDSPHIAALDAALKLPEGMTRADFFARVCPPLPPNFEIAPDEPEALLSADARNFRSYVRKNWNEEDWRLHRWAYARLTERVDGQIGKVLAALRESGLEDDTVVVFTSDHGDMDSAHRLEHKSVCYDEASRVPLIVSRKGVTKPGLVDAEHLVSTTLDLIPTLCDFAGIAVPEELAGRSLRPLAEGQSPASWRRGLVTECRMSRMVRSPRYKYVVYSNGERREQLIDMETDPGEMQNLATDPAYASVLAEHRNYLVHWYEAHGEKLDPSFVVR